MRETYNCLPSDKTAGQNVMEVTQETGVKGYKLMGEKETYNCLPSDKAAGQNVMEVTQETGGKGYKLMGERERHITVCLVTRLQDRM